MGISVKIDTSQSSLNQFYSLNKYDFILTSIDEEECEFNVDCSRLYSSIDELTEEAIEAFEADLDKFIDEIS